MTMERVAKLETADERVALRSPDHLFEWLAFSLSPWKSSEEIRCLRRAMAQQPPAWGPLLQVANRQFCTPMWYAALHRDGLLPALPGELREYLHALHEESVERNEMFRGALRELLRSFDDRGIPSLLLKGAATFCDDLYQDPGARMMGDLDLLIPPEWTDAAQAALAALGYRSDPPHRERNATLFDDNEHHHLPRQLLPGTPVVVELHTRLARRQGGRVLPEAEVWKHRRRSALDGVPALLPSPEHRLLHNVVHATLPHREFIRSRIALPHLIEFSHLARRYGEGIHWAAWQARGARHGFSTEISAYLQLVQRLTAMPRPAGVAPSVRAMVHGIRFVMTERHGADQKPRGIDAGRRITKALLRGYYWIKEPAWLWRNFFYKPGFRHAPLRIKYLLRRYFSGMRSLDG